MLSDEDRPAAFTIYDTTTASGLLRWAASDVAPRRHQVLQVARGNARIGVFSHTDVEQLIAAGYVELSDLR